MEHKPLEHLRIGVFGKGGSGKSTITVFLATALRERGYSVLVLDADSTNHGLAAALGADAEPDPLLDYFGGMVFSGGLVTCPVDDPTPLPGARAELDQLPGRFVSRNSNGVLLLAAGKLGGLGPGAGCDGPVAKIARDLAIEDYGPHPVMLVDFKAGFEDVARGALTTTDWALAVVDPTTAALAMTHHLAAMVEQIQRGVPPATRHLAPVDVEQAIWLYSQARVQGVAAVLNRVATASVDSHLRRELRGGGAPVVAAFPEEPAVGRQWLDGRRLHSRRLSEAGHTLVAGLEQLALSGHAIPLRTHGGVP
jgi:CO dehydrogenase nickel-insertion accessory protein CooC1